MIARGNARRVEPMLVKCKEECRYCNGYRTYTPIEAFNEAVIAGFLSSQGFKPGVVVERLPACLRRAIANLTSDEALTVRNRYV